MFDVYLSRWNLVPDGNPVTTRNARLLPVRHDGEPAMLKLAVPRTRTGSRKPWRHPRPLYGNRSHPIDRTARSRRAARRSASPQRIGLRSTGWLAIDPKGLVGERGFDFANIFTNPDLDNPTRPLARCPASSCSQAVAFPKQASPHANMRAWYRIGSAASGWIRGYMERIHCDAPKQP
jgi:hypothetical protein